LIGDILALCEFPNMSAGGLMLTALRCTLFPFDMVRNFTTALVAALVLGSASIASARPAWETTPERVFGPSIEHYDGWTYPQSEEPYCYLPSWPCEQPTPRNKPTP
jgi:hypothetical protein